MIKAFKVKVPATVANMGPGFDVMGFALDMFLTVSVSFNSESAPEPDPKDALMDAFFSIAKEKKSEIPKNLSIVQENKPIPRKKGLGSSAAARVAGVVIAHRILKLGLSPEDIAQYAAKLEGHPDNAVPALSGGITLCYQKAGVLKYSKISIPPSLKVVVAIPNIETVTKEARGVLPDTLPLKDAVYSVARASLLVKALMKEEYSLLGEAMQDCIHQPIRKKYIPGFDAIVRQSIDAGAYGTAISGSGPSVFSFVPPGKEKEVGRAMTGVWHKKNIDSKYAVCNMSEKGVEIIE